MVEIMEVCKHVTATRKGLGLSVQMPANLLEQPWVADGAPAYHEPGGVGLGQDTFGFGGGVDVAISEDGAGQGVGRKPNEVVVYGASIAFLYGTAVDG